MTNEDEKLLADYANVFLGFGNPRSDVWLIGAEAGGGKTVREILDRAYKWSQRGRKEMEDLHSYHESLDQSTDANWTKKIQPTWGSLIRIILAKDGEPATTSDVKDFQRDKWGLLDGKNAVIDLSQLSVPNKSVWILDQLGIGWLKTREIYEASTLPKRSALLKSRIEASRPKLIIFYGLGQICIWEDIAGSAFAPSGTKGLSWTEARGTLYTLVPHPNAIREKGRGAKCRYLEAIGYAIRRRMETMQDVSPTTAAIRQ